jgi:DNA polymerase eta
MASAVTALASQPDLERRIVVHIDMDCFYAQVERKRLDLPPDVPLCVVQWDSVLAVSYAARAFGIKRGESPAEVKAKCPDCVLVHVETVDALGNRTSVSDLDMSTDATSARASHTVCLDRYRQESELIFRILGRFANCIERCSIDEAFIELTEVVDDFEEAVRLTQRIRECIYAELGYTCSAGVASNKMLAKYASATNKPNKLTAIPWSETACLLPSIELARVRGLGGKFGVELQRRFQVETLADLSRLPLTALQEAYEPSTAEWLFWLARGHDPSKVEARDCPRSLLAAKSFAPIEDWSEARQVLFLLATRLNFRVEQDAKKHHRRPRTLCVSFSCSMNGARGDRFHHLSRSGAFPTSPRETGAHCIAANAEKLLRSGRSGFRFPCTRFMLEATNFQEIASGANSIRHYLSIPAKRSLKVQHVEAHAAQQESSGHISKGAETAFEFVPENATIESQNIADDCPDASAAPACSTSVLVPWKRQCVGEFKSPRSPRITSYFMQPKRSEMR